MSTIAIITARGGSKRIPRKNVKPFLGHPIIEYSIRATINASVFDTIMVSTDDEEIAQIARACGAEVPFLRSEATSNDYATTSDVLFEVFQEYQKLGKTFENACCVYPTAPFVNGDMLRDAMIILQKEKADSVMPVVKFSFPPQRGVVIRNGALVANTPEYMNMRSQDLEPMYHDCGQFYCFHVESFMEQKKLVMNKTVPYLQDEMSVQDIDTEEDWKMAELKMQLLKENGGRC